MLASSQLTTMSYLPFWCEYDITWIVTLPIRRLPHCCALNLMQKSKKQDRKAAVRRNRVPSPIHHARHEEAENTASTSTNGPFVSVKQLTLLNPRFIDPRTQM